MNPKIVYMGSPEFAVPILEALAKEYSVVGVITQPDRPSGRGKVLTPPPVKTCAERLGLEVIQPERLRQSEAQEHLVSWKPDLIVVAAYGQILRQNVLDLPRYGCINVHASLLPRWRGAAPIQAAILHGDLETGVTIMKMNTGIDTGDILSAEALPIQPDDTSTSLGNRLSVLGAALLIKTLPLYLEGKITPQKQKDTLACYAPMLKKEDGLLDFSKPAEELSRRIRAFTPWPGTYMIHHREVLKVHRAHPADGPVASWGEKQVLSGQPAVATAKGWLILDEVQSASKKPMPGKAFLQGCRNWSDR